MDNELVDLGWFLFINISRTIWPNSKIVRANHSYTAYSFKNTYIMDFVTCIYCLTVQLTI